MSTLTPVTVHKATASSVQTHAVALSQARSILKDHDTEFRYTDTELIQFINDFYAEVDRLRPDLTYDLLKDGNYPVSYSVIGDIPTTTFLIDPAYFPALPMYIAGRALMRDDQFAEAGVASGLIAQALAKLAGGV